MWSPLIAILSFLLIYIIFKKVKSKDKIPQIIKKGEDEKKETEKKNTTKTKTIWLWAIILILIVIAGYSGHKYYFSSPNLPSYQQARAAEMKTVILHWKLLRTVKAPVDEWSKKESTPSGLFRIATMKENDKVEILGNGKYFQINPSERVDLGNVDEFQVRGIGKEVMIGIYTAEY